MLCLAQRLFSVLHCDIIGVHNYSFYFKNLFFKGDNNMAGWTSLKWLINDEIAQRREEGCCVDGFDKLLGEAGEDRDAS